MASKFIPVRLTLDTGSAERSARRFVNTVSQIGTEGQASTTRFNNALDKVETKSVSTTGRVRAAFGQYLSATFFADLGAQAATAFISAARQLVSDAIRLSQETRNAFLGLSSLATFKGVDAKVATESVKNLDLVKKGLLEVGSTSTALKNLLAAGFSLEESITLVKRLADAAAFGRAAHLSLSEAVETATQGIKNQNSELVDNSGVTKNLSVILKERGFQLEDLTDKLKGAAAREALYKGLLAETAGQLGDTDKLLNTYTGSVLQHEAAQRQLQVTLGDVITQSPAIINANKAQAEQLRKLSEETRNGASENSQYLGTIIKIYAVLKSQVIPFTNFFIATQAALAKSLIAPFRVGISVLTSFVSAALAIAQSAQTKISNLIRSGINKVIEGLETTGTKELAERALGITLRRVELIPETAINIAGRLGALRDDVAGIFSGIKQSLTTGINAAFDGAKAYSQLGAAVEEVNKAAREATNNQDAAGKASKTQAGNHREAALAASREADALSNLVELRRELSSAAVQGPNQRNLSELEKAADKARGIILKALPDAQAQKGQTLGTFDFLEKFTPEKLRAQVKAVLDVANGLDFTKQRREIEEFTKAASEALASIKIEELNDTGPLDAALGKRLAALSDLQSSLRIGGAEIEGQRLRGLITEQQARDQIILLERRQRDELLRLLDVELALAEITGDVRAIDQLREQIAETRNLGAELTRQEEIRRRLADLTILDTSRLNEGVEDLLASQKSITETLSDFRRNSVEQTFTALDKAVDKLAERFGVASDASKQLLKDLLRLATTKLLEKVFNLQSPGTVNIGGAQQSRGFNPGGLIQQALFGGNGGAGGTGGFTTPPFVPQSAAGGNAGGGSSTGFSLGGFNLKQIGGFFKGIGGGIGRLFGLGGAKAASSAAAGALPISDLTNFALSQKLDTSGLAARGISAGPSAAASLGATGLLAGGGLLGSLLGGQSQFGKLLGGVGGALGAGALGATGIFGGGIAAALPALFSNPITAVIAGGLLLGGFLLGRRAARELNDYKRLIKGEYGIEVKDKQVLQQVREIGKQTFGKEYRRHQLETIRLDDVKSLLTSYAESTGQANNKLIQAKQLSDPFDARNQFVAREFGGPVLPGIPYLVGERRPEVFVPDRPGRVVPSIAAFTSGQSGSSESEQLRAEMREIGKQTFGTEYRKDQLETIRLDDLKSLLIQPKQLGDPFKARNQFVAREFGGPVRPGVDYLVGEKRAEVVRFQAPGAVFPSVASAGASGRSAELAELRADLRALSRAMMAMQEEMITTFKPFRAATPGEVLVKAIEQQPDAVPGAVSESVRGGDRFGIRANIYGV
jgi:hypothetical protein